MIKSYKYRLDLTEKQKKFFEMQFGCCRYVYNWSLSKKINSYKLDKTNISSFELIKGLINLKSENEWLKLASSDSLQQSILCMESSFKRFFREKNGFPKFKSKKNCKNSCKFLNNCSIDFLNKKIKLPKVGSINFYCDRVFNGKIGGITVSKSNTNKYYVSIIVDDRIELPLKSDVEENTSIGIDVGIKSFATLSNGVVIENPKFLNVNFKKLKIHQRRFSKKKSGSNRYKKQKLRVCKIHERIKNLRSDFLHNISKRIVSENQTIIIEDLNVSGLRKNSRLCTSITDASWGLFFKMLEYKCFFSGKNLIRIGQFEPSSKMCSCGEINNNLKLSDRIWTCNSCGETHDRDLLAANNIKKFGLAKINTPAASGGEDVELSALVGAKKRQRKQNL